MHRSYFIYKNMMVLLTVRSRAPRAASKQGNRNHHIFKLMYSTSKGKWELCAILSESPLNKGPGHDNLELHLPVLYEITARDITKLQWEFDSDKQCSQKNFS